MNKAISKACHFVEVITKSSTFRSTGIVTGATIVNGFLGFVFYFLLARFFQPATLGTFTVAVTAASLITDVGVVGTETGVINFVGKFIVKDREKALRFFKLAFEAKVFVAVLVIVLGWFLVPEVAINFFGKSELVVPLRYSLFIASALLLFGFGTSGVQALQKFRVWGFLNIFSNAGRLIVMYIFFVIGILTVDSGLVIYAIFPFIAFVMALAFLPNFFGVRNEREVSHEFFHYSKWVAIFTLIGAISSRLDTFLVTKLLTLTDVGIYSVAVTLSGIVPQLVGAVGTVVAPKLASFDSNEKAIVYLKKLQLFVGALSFVGIISGALIGYVVITKFYPIAYVTSYLPFLILLIAQAVFLFSIPAHITVIYYFSYPKLFILVSIVNILVVGVSGFFLISSFGFVGGAIAVLFGNIVNFIIPATWVVRKFKEK